MIWTVNGGKLNVIDYGFSASEVTTCSAKALYKFDYYFWRHKHKAAGVSTRRQAVARIADRTASQHLWGSRDVIGHSII